MDTKSTYPENVFTSFKELLKMEALSHNFSFLARKHKSNSILAGKHASRLRGRGLDFEEVRKYVNGDDIRNIDWKVTARTQTTHTRVYTEEKERPVLIVVDHSKSMFFGSQVRTKAVVAAELAAIAAFRILNEGDRVGGVVYADKGIDMIYPKRDRKNILKFLNEIVKRNHELAESESASFEDSLKEVIQKIKNIVTHDFLIIIISDFLRYHPKTIKTIKHLKLHNDLILAKVNDPMEREIPEENIVAGDAETQIRLRGKSKELRNRFKSEFDTELSSFKEEMLRYGIPVLNLNTVEPVDEQLKKMF
ncbi:DUF58 domain-containing protein [Gramella lutea]|uniref:DUF58 domain-containing protein n=1 Tax=Christiangramia lutea TaxID=1607951 RepID=A0A9X1V0S4_9FLAO|nr:DUF58 domain-containing protein [Christiangramia lutea]MCH4821750.1 DUF58 domain-containing protein [Christiangramia lutea]